MGKIAVFLFISGGEIFFVFAIALLLFGSKAIPDIARLLGKGVREFKKATSEIKKELDESTGGIKKEFDEISSDMKETSRDIQNNINKNIED